MSGSRFCHDCSFVDGHHVNCPNGQPHEEDDDADEWFAVVEDAVEDAA